MATPSNLFISNCKIPDAYKQGYNNLEFRRDVEPSNKTGYSIYNPQLLSDRRLSNDFIEAKCDIRGCGGGKLFYSPDPRLISASHNGQVTLLDNIPVDDNVRLADINTDKSLDNYGQNYKTYSDINAGQIMYYYDEEKSGPFFKPNFTTHALSVGTLFRDPMGAFRPQYNRYQEMNNPITHPESCFPNGCGLSALSDSSYHRQDLMSLQMRKRNEQRFTPRWHR